MTQARLLIDVGNTRTKWGWQPAADSIAFIDVGDCDSHLNAADMAQALLGMSHTHGIDLSVASAVYGACVAGEAVRQNVAHALRALTLAMPMPTPNVHWVSNPMHSPTLRNDYATPHTLGVDRYLACLGLATQLRRSCAPDSTPPAAVLATFGTATTVDAICWDGVEHRYVFMGGIIIAGLAMALRSLNIHTALLPDLSQSQSQSQRLSHAAAMHLIPNTTEQALWQGACRAQAGAVLSVVASLKATLDASAPSVCLHIAGGAAHDMKPYLAAFTPQQSRAAIQTVAHPVLLGLAAYCG